MRRSGSISISIHAPRVRSDRRRFVQVVRFPYFNPRSPCEERQQKSTNKAHNIIAFLLFFSFTTISCEKVLIYFFKSNCYSYFFVLSMVRTCLSFLNSSRFAPIRLHTKCEKTKKSVPPPDRMKLLFQIVQYACYNYCRDDRFSDCPVFRQWF